MLFLSFASQEERRRCGGSAFIELQYCTLPRSSKLKKIVSVRRVKHWLDDSLYINAIKDTETFLMEYGEIFRHGVHNDLKSGDIDLWGINYYPPNAVAPLIDRISEKKPRDWETVTQWLRAGENHNGFYILGV